MFYNIRFKRGTNVLGKIEVEGGNLDQYRTFYSCLYRSLLFPRKFYELDVCRQTGLLITVLIMGKYYWIYVYRHRLLGYFPLPIPVIESNVPVSQQRNAGRSDQYI
ncbi:MAG: glycoside hydrolase domain-containing protein [Bacteroides thetaiotaomicron]